MRGRVSLSRAATLECVWPKQRISNSWNGDRPVSFRKFRRFSIVPNLAAEFIVAICLAHSNIFHHAYLLYKVFNAKIHENIIQTFNIFKTVHVFSNENKRKVLCFDALPPSISHLHKSICAMCVSCDRLNSCFPSNQFHSVLYFEYMWISTSQNTVRLSLEFKVADAKRLYEPRSLRCHHTHKKKIGEICRKINIMKGKERKKTWKRWKKA